MASQWRVVDCSSLVGRIRSVRGAVVVEPSEGEPTRVPMADVACVLIGPKVLLSGGALHRLTEQGTAVLLCDWRGVPEAGAFAWSAHTRIARRRRAQADLSLPRQKSAWQAIVRAKILHQARTIAAVGGDAARLQGLARQVRSGDPGNVEGVAARLYWAKLFGADFRRCAGAGEGVNGMLDYAYGVARGHAIRAVLAAGLEPSLGAHHRHRENMFCLADDVIEVVRPVVDFAVWRLWRDGVAAVGECRAELVQAAAAEFSADGYTVPTVLEDLAQAYGNYVEGEVARLVVPRWTADLG